MGTADLSDGPFATIFVCFSGGVRKEFFTKDGMISEIFDQGPRLARVSEPFNGGGGVWWWWWEERPRPPSAFSWT